MEAITTETPRENAAARSRIDHAASLARLGLPMIGAQMAQMAIHMTDIAMVGRVGATELAATALAANYFFIVYIFGSGFLIALSPVLAQAFGAGDLRTVRRAVRMGLWFAVFYGVVAIPALLIVEPTLLGLGQKPNVAAIASTYMSIACLSLLPSLIFSVFRSFLGAINLSGILLWVALFGVALNAALNWVFIFGNLGAPAFGVQGAALATVLTNVAMALAVALYATYNRAARVFQVLVRVWQPDWSVLKSSLALGLPISLTIIAETGMFQAASLIAGALGVVPLAAHSIVMQLVSFSFMVPYGLSHAATVRVGQDIGGGNTDDARRAGETALLAAIIASLITIALFVAFPQQLIRVFLPASDPKFAETLALAIPLLLTGAAFNLFDGMQAIAAGNLRGIKDTKLPMWIAILSYWGLGVPVAWALAFHSSFGVTGVWIGLAVGVFAASILLNMRFFRKIDQTIALA
jgi:multidrug resistance protein, MATE family